MNRTAIAITAVLIGGVLSSCFDVIDVELQEAPEQLVIDAWLNDKSEKQTIRLTLSQPYFNNSFAPAVEDAQVAVTDSTGKIFVFNHEGDGNYSWTPDGNENLGSVGMKFFLGIDWNGQQFVSESVMNRVPPIDSIQVEFRESELGLPEGHYAALFARDPTGLGDVYWIKSYKNGEFLNKPFELNLAYDAGFDAGAEVDGIIFITPIREAINRVPDDEGPDNSDVPPWAPGDTITVEIHSLTIPAWKFMSIARDQMTNGANTIFAIPLANAVGNILDVDDQEPALGVFCVSAISSMTKVVE